MVSPQFAGFLMPVQKSELFHNLAHNGMRLPIANEIDTSACFQRTNTYAD